MHALGEISVNLIVAMIYRVSLAVDFERGCCTVEFKEINRGVAVGGGNCFFAFPASDSVRF